jgi:hypothetical protein
MCSGAPLLYLYVYRYETLNVIIHFTYFFQDFFHCHHQINLLVTMEKALKEICEVSDIQPLSRTVMLHLSVIFICSFINKRPCATNRKVAGSIPNGVIGIFH